jgi:hypothetical protein
MVKIISGKTRQRIVLPDFKMEKIIGWDADNAYPQRVLDLILASGTASSCVKTYKRFIKGQGFADVGQKIKYGKLLESIADDKSKLGTFAIHVQWNELGDIVKLSHVPVEYCRLGTDGMICVYNNWDKRSLRENYDVTKIRRYNSYNPLKLGEQIEAAEGIENYNGQIMWVKPDDSEYPLAPCDSILQDIKTDSSVQTFKNKNIRTNFMASHMFVHKGKFESEQAKQEFEDYLEHFQGAESVGNIMLLEAEMDEAIPELKPFTIQNNDKLWEFTETSIKNNIVQNYMIPPVLAGILQSGRLGTASEIEDATIYYNDITKDDRIEIESALKLLLGENVSIVEMGAEALIAEMGGGAEKTIEKISLNGAQITSLLQVIESKNAGIITKDAAIEIIINAFPSISRDDAAKMVP